jgi:hypothetical protein
MDPVSLIVGALAVGAAAGLPDTAGTAVWDAYQGLRDLVRHRFTDRPTAEVALAEHEKAPEIWQQPLIVELELAGACCDEAIIAAAQQVMGLVDAAGARAGKYAVNLQGAQGAQARDGNFQSNTFTDPPRA